MKFLIAIVLTTLFMMAASSAHAGWVAGPTPASVASAYWPDSACHGREVVVPVSNEEGDALFGHDNVYAYAGIGDSVTCKAYVTQRFYTATASQQCAMLTHEFGHLSGLEHDDSYPNVMNGVILFIPDVCQRFDAPSPPPSFPQGRGRQRILHIH